MHKLFVYGTLMPGFGNNVLLKDATYLGEGFVEGTLLDLGGIPGYLINGNYDIAGHVYAVDDVTLARCDRLEGYDPKRIAESMYTREVVQSTYMEGDVPVFDHVYIYEWNGETNYRVIESGDYGQYRKQRV